jgi:hypothetical protein
VAVAQEKFWGCSLHLTPWQLQSTYRSQQGYIYPNKVIILFFPPNCTSLLQPADIRMIAGLKVGYRVSMLRKLLAICDDEELYDEALIAGKKGTKGM